MSAYPPYLQQGPAGESVAEQTQAAEGSVVNSLSTLADLFEQIAIKYGSREAVTFGDQHLTYSQLHARSSRVAEALQIHGVGPDTLVGVFMDRSADTIVALAAILKAGGAYLPLEPAYPSERLAMILEDARPAVVLTEAGLIEKLPPQTAPVLLIEDVSLAVPGAASGKAIVSPKPIVRPENLAYVIYTSGSTGRPKGVMVTHANVVRLLTATAHWFHFDENDVWTFFHSYAFDFSVWEIWGCLLHGGRLVVAPFWVTRSPQDFFELLVKEQVTVLNQTPAAFYQLAAVAESSPARLPALRLVIFGGEALNFRSLQRWFSLYGNAKPQLVNMYGITETTVHVTYRIVTASDASGGAQSLIGVPIPDMQLHVLDENLRPVPPGQTGEIFVGGAGVARGYLNRPELNAERFLSDPFSANPRARLYRSGDLARFLPDGELEYLGRGDSQVKIQGFRIELGEIEAAIAQHPGIQQVCVLAHTDAAGSKRLVAYYVRRGEQPNVTAHELSDFLNSKLPPYMMPSVYMPIAALPLTSNGKVDRAALPAPAVGSTASEPEPDGSELEQKIAGLWREVLGARRVGLDDNFFEIGGTSILLVRVHAGLQELLGRRIAITDLFASTTVRALSERLSPTSSSSDPLDITQRRAQRQRDAFARARATKNASL